MVTTVSKNRIEALSDGVFAIAMTLLILDIKVPAGIAPGQLGAALEKDSHGWISFAITFFLTSVFWTLQHRVFDLLKSVNRQMLVSAFAFLALVSVLPFSTSLWGHYLKEPLALVFYFGNQFAIAVALTVKLELARFHGFLHRGIESELTRFRLYGMCVVMFTMGATAYFVPLDRIWPIPLALGLIGRGLRKASERKLTKEEQLAASKKVAIPD